MESKAREENPGPSKPTGNTLVALAHPDDELAIYKILEELLKNGEPLHFLYLSNGDSNLPKDRKHRAEEIRGRETVKALRRIGVLKENINFLGFSEDEMLKTLFVLGDKIKAMNLMRKIIQKTRETLEKIGPVKRVITTAYEGGHPIHDLWNAIITTMSGIPFEEIETWVTFQYSGVFPFKTRVAERPPYSPPEREKAEDKRIGLIGGVKTLTPEQIEEKIDALGCYPSQRGCIHYLAEMAKKGNGGREEHIDRLESQRNHSIPPEKGELFYESYVKTRNTILYRIYKLITTLLKLAKENPRIFLNPKKLKKASWPKKKPPITFKEFKRLIEWCREEGFIG